MHNPCSHQSHGVYGHHGPALIKKKKTLIPIDPHLPQVHGHQDQVLLWYLCMGHSSLGVLIYRFQKCLYFVNKVECETCQFAKHSSTMFPITHGYTKLMGIGAFS